MFADPLAITYNAVVKNLVKVNQDNYSSEYYLDDNTTRFRGLISHTIPALGKFGEFHALRLEAEILDGTTYDLIRKDQAWIGLRTDSGYQNTTTLKYLASALTALADSGNLDKLIGRQS